MQPELHPPQCVQAQQASSLPLLLSLAAWHLRHSRQPWLKPEATRCDLTAHLQMFVVLGRHLSSHKGHVQLAAHHSPTHPARAVHLHLHRDLQVQHKVMPLQFMLG